MTWKFVIVVSSSQLQTTKIENMKFFFSLVIVAVSAISTEAVKFDSFEYFDKLCFTDVNMKPGAATDKSSSTISIYYVHAIVQPCGSRTITSASIINYTFQPDDFS